MSQDTLLSYEMAERGSVFNANGMVKQPRAGVQLKPYFNLFNVALHVFSESFYHLTTNFRWVQNASCRLDFAG